MDPADGAGQRSELPDPEAWPDPAPRIQSSETMLACAPEEAFSKGHCWAWFASESAVISAKTLRPVLRVGHAFRGASAVPNPPRWRRAARRDRDRGGRGRAFACLRGEGESFAPIPFCFRSVPRNCWMVIRLLPSPLRRGGTLRPSGARCDRCSARRRSQGTTWAASRPPTSRFQPCCRSGPILSGLVSPRCPSHAFPRSCESGRTTCAGPRVRLSPCVSISLHACLSL